MTNRTIVIGSLQDVANKTGRTVHQLLRKVKKVVAIDTSLSMIHVRDAGETRDVQRYAEACRQLAVLQEKYPGQIAVISWSEDAVWCFDGVPAPLKQGTEITPALKLFADLDGLCDLIIASDGGVGDPFAALGFAATLTSKIETVYIGDPDDEDADDAMDFLKALAAAGRGTFTQSVQPGDLIESVTPLLGAPAAPEAANVIAL